MAQDTHATEPGEKTGSDSDLEDAVVLLEDVKVRQEFRGWTLLWLTYQTIGVIYGDIATSTLYVFSSTFTSNPEPIELICSVSLIIWTLVIMVTIKYICIVLYADDAGEGGTFALYSLISRYAEVESPDARISLVRFNRFKTGDLARPTRAFRSLVERSNATKTVVRCAAIFGVCAVMADGILTPAQSVLGAIQGLEVIKPDISTSTIVGVTIAILVLLFAIQPLGISRLGSTYAPIVIIWLLLNVASGIYNLVVYDHHVLVAFNPYYAGRWFTVAGDMGWKRLGGILLAFTGVEALFADLGAFSRRAIQLSWMCFVLPSLVVAYLGQAAYLSSNPGAYTNPFFASLPPHVFYFGLVMSILAAIIASQAMITGAFQILVQAMNLSFFPRLKVVYTSTTFHGQCYIGLANWLLMVGTIIVTGVFHNTTRLGNAYGLCVILVTFITTNLTAIVALIVWRIHPLIVIPLYLLFASFDGMYLSTALFKVPQGAWFSFAIAAILACVMALWRYGKTLQWNSERSQTLRLGDVVNLAPDNTFTLKSTGQTVSRMPGVGVFFDERAEGIPAVFIHWLSVFGTRHDVGIFVHLRQAVTPTVNDQERYLVTRVQKVPNGFNCLVRYGYNEVLAMTDLATTITGAVERFLISDLNTLPPEMEGHARAQAELNLFQISQSTTTFMFGKKELRAAPTRGKLQIFILQAFFIMRDLLMANPRLWDLPGNQVIEIGRIVTL